MEQHVQHGASLPDADHTVIIHRVPVAVPDNICEWVAPATLQEWVGQSIQEHYLPTGATQSSLDNLRLLLLALCRGKFDLEEIAAGSHTDFWLKKACPQQVPFANELSNCCRAEQHTLELLLARILIRAAREKLSLGGVLPPGLEATLAEYATGRVRTMRCTSPQEE